MDGNIFSEEFVKYLLVILMLLIPCFSFAQKKISFIAKGQTAPMDGILLSPEAFAELEVSSQLEEERIRLVVDKEVALAKAKIQLQLDNEAIKRELERLMYEDRLKLKNNYILWLEAKALKESETTFWQDWKFEIGLVSGVVSGFTIFYAGAKAVGTIK